MKNAAHHQPSYWIEVRAISAQPSVVITWKSVNMDLPTEPNQMSMSSFAWECKVGKQWGAYGWQKWKQQHSHGNRGKHI